jgi:hypothetical protein
MMEERKMGWHKKDFDVAMFFSSQNIDFPFLFDETLGAFLFLSLFSVLSLSFSSMLRPFEDSRILMIFGEKTAFKNSFQMAWDVWLILNCEDGGVVDISAVGACSRVESCTPIFLDEASK